MFVLEILDNWANLQEREGGRSTKKSRFAKICDLTDNSEKLVGQKEFLKNSTRKRKKQSSGSIFLK